MAKPSVESRARRAQAAPGVAAPGRGASASIHEVAAEAGVSIATVSRVLNDLSRVAPATRARVQQAIERLRYRPNLLARGLVQRQAGAVGLVLPDLFGDFYGELMRGVDEGARQAGLRLNVSRASGSDEERSTIEQLLGSGAVDGLIVLVTELTDSVLESVKAYGQAIVVLDKDVGGARIDNILVDNRSSARLVTEHLIGLGRRELLFLGGPSGNIDTRDRAAGFLDAARVAGLDIDAARDLVFGSYEYETGYDLAHRMAPRLREARPSGGLGVFAANDDLARGFIQGIEAQGFEVPADAAVAGHDDSRLARLVRPQLTSVRVPLRELGRSAVRMLKERLSGERQEPAKMIFTGELIARVSTLGAARPPLAIEQEPDPDFAPPSLLAARPQVSAEPAPGGPADAVHLNHPTS